ncbi:MAG: MBL fold metallo-hydrolase [Planctomycetota bacterium]
MMLTFACQSGSNGNCIFVQAGRTRLVIDAGISGKQAAMRMAAHGHDIRRADALLLSHDHSDHSRCAGIFQRKFALPLYGTGATLSACKHVLGKVHDVRPFAAGDTLEIGDAVVHTLATPHDGVDGVCFVIEHDGRRLGVLTDLGFVFPELEQLLPTLDAAYLESNYDPAMLARGPYPPYLQARIRGDGGHLANAEAATLVEQFTDGRLAWAALAHLSEQNNTPEVALATARATVRPDLPLHVARRTGASEIWSV